MSKENESGGLEERPSSPSVVKSHPGRERKKPSKLDDYILEDLCTTSSDTPQPVEGAASIPQVAMTVSADLPDIPQLSEEKSDTDSQHSQDALLGPDSVEPHDGEDFRPGEFFQETNKSVRPHSRASHSSRSRHGSHYSSRSSVRSTGSEILAQLLQQQREDALTREKQFRQDALAREEQFRRDALEREKRASEALEKERDRAAAQALEYTRLVTTRLQSAPASRQNSRGSTRDNSPIGRQSRTEEQPARAPQPPNGHQANTEDLEGRLVRLPLERQAIDPENGPSLPVTQLHNYGQLEPQAGFSINQRPLEAAVAPHYDPLPQRPPGSAIPFFKDDSRSQYHDMRMCLEFLLGGAHHSEQQKFIELSMHCKLPAAKLICTANAYSPTPYTSALKALDERWGRPWDHILDEIHELGEMPDIKDDQALDAYTLKIQALVSMLKFQGAAGQSELYAGSNVERFVRKIPKEREERFRREHERLYPNKPLSNLIEFSEFLQSETRHIRLPKQEDTRRNGRDKFDRTSVQKGRSTRVLTTIPGTPTKESQEPPKGKWGGSSAKREEKRPPPKCQCCAESHWLDNCPAFKEKSTDEKKQWILNNKRCWKCAREHLAKDCTLKGPCRQSGCGKIHLTALHEVNNRGSKVKSDIVETPGEPPEGIHTYYVGPVRGSNPRVLLKIVPVVLHHLNKTLETYAVIDDGSERTLLMHEAANALGLKGEAEKIDLLTIQPGRTTITGKSVNFSITPAGRPKEVYEMSHVFTAADLSLSRYGYPMELLVKRYPHLGNLGINLAKEVKPTLLLGSDNVRLTLPKHVIQGPQGCPIAVQTPLGWTLQGPISLRNQNTLQTHCLFIGAGHEDGALLENVQRLWQLDVSPYKNVKMYTRSKEDHRAMDLLQNKTKRVQVRGVLRYATPLLRKEPMPTFKVPPGVVMPCLLSVERRLSRDPEMAVAYATEMNQLIESGLVKKLDPAEAERSIESWYLPHHNVKHNGKNRVVFNCSFQVRQQNLNRYLLPGPTLTPPLLGVMVRFRRQKTAISGDIKRMFHQVCLLDEDKPLMRFLWRESPEDPEPSIYQWEVLPFGTTCSPCCATYALQRHVDDATAPPGVPDTVHHSFYVDNCLHSVETAEEAHKLVRDLRTFLASGGFEVRQWASNDPEVIRDLPEDAKSNSSETWVSQSSDNAQEMTLGLVWRFKSDTLCYRHPKIEPRKYVTMRSIYSTLASQYDPLGYIIPYTTRAKVLVRDLWTEKKGWDDPLPESLAAKWKEWEQELPNLQQIEFPRSYFPPSVSLTNSKISLHVFCDASETAYGAVAYLRAEEPDDTVHVSFLLARSRVAPKRQQSIPRLELCAALSGAQMGKMLKEELHLPLCEVWMWSDSTTVIQWIQSTSCKYKVFVGTRVSEIQELVGTSCWRYVATDVNPADVITRGATLNQLAHPNLYHQGPDYLLRPETEWPPLPSLENAEVEEELKKTQFCGLTGLQDDSITDGPKVEDCQTLEELQVQTFRHQNPNLGDSTSLTADDYAAAEMLVVQRVQREVFRTEMTCLERKVELPRDSKLRQLAPELDDNGVIRVGGRLRRAQNLTEDSKHPILLPSKHPVTDLVIRQYDNKLYHPGAERLFAEIRRRFWILRGREAVRRYQRLCTVCQKLRAQPIMPRMADLPPCRLRLQEAPFHNTGMDCFGPFSVKAEIGRATAKRWGIIFKCLTTRAVHLEVLAEMTTDSFLQSFRRFTGRRGRPHTLWSDHGTNFRGGEAELIKSYNQMSDELKAELASQQVRFSYNPPNAPHFGGAWEREVRSVKTALNAALGAQVPKAEVFNTLLVEIEAMLNSKPLGYVSSDVADLDPVTPNSLLMGRRDAALPLAVYASTEIIGRRQWRYGQALADQFWKRFTSEYLPSLQGRRKWMTDRANIEQGTPVMIVDPALPRARWLIGRVKSVVKGNDGRVRSAVVDTGGRTYHRPVARLIQLPPYSDSVPSD